MKRIIIFLLIILSPILQGQSFDKAWASLEKRIRAGEVLSAKDQLEFLDKYKKDFESYPIQKSILYNGLGNDAFGNENYKDAISYFNNSIELAEKAKDTVYLALYNYDLATLYNHVGYYANAEPLYLKALPTLSAYYGQSSIEYTMRFKVLTEMYVEMGRYNEAKLYNDALLHYFKTLRGEQDREYLICLNNDARISQGYGEYDKAIEIFNKLMHLHGTKNPIDTADYITTINNTAEAYRQLQNYKEAIALFEKALQLSYRFSQNDNISLATIYNNYGLCYKATGDYQNAEKSFDNCTAIYKKLKLDFIPDYTNSLSNKADMYRLLGRNKQAYDLLLEVKDIREKSLGTKHINYANTITNMALVRISDYSASGMKEHLTEAESLLLQAKEIYAESLGEYHPFYANCINNISMLYLHLKRYQEAEVFKLRALDIVKKMYGDTNVRYANFLGGTISLYEANGNYKKAIENVEKANTIIKKELGEKHIDYIDGNFNLAYLKWKTKDYKGAEKLFIATLPLYQFQFNSFFESMSENEQISFYFTVSEKFERLNKFMIEYTKLFPKENHNELIATCFNNQLFLKSILLNQSISTRRQILNSNDTALINTYEKWLNTKQVLAGIFRDSDYEKNYWNEAELQLECDKLEQKIKSLTNSFRKTNTINYKQISDRLNVNEAAITILREELTINDSTASTEYIALLVKKSSLYPQLIRFKSSELFENSFLDHYQDNIENKKEDKLSYDRFWKQIAEQLNGISKVYLTADGVFNKVNLYTLQNPVTGKYIIDEFEISILPNLTYLNDTYQSNNNNTAQLFGNPDYEYDFSKKTSSHVLNNAIAKNRFGFSELPPLPGTQTEVDNITQSLKSNKWNINTYTKTEATEAKLKTVKSPKVLHIATHGFFLKDIDELTDKTILGFESNNLKSNPLLRSGIMMAGASVVARDTANIYKEQDGIFTAYEASLLNLTNTDLVVLSACETGLGVELNNQGVFGLQRAFYIAGAKNLIMSLWIVDDHATQLLMSEFYKLWSVNPTQKNISTAFKKAQTSVRNQYPHPYYWGAFVLLGK